MLTNSSKIFTLLYTSFHIRSHIRECPVELAIVVFHVLIRLYIYDYINFALKAFSRHNNRICTAMIIIMYNIHGS